MTEARQASVWPWVVIAVVLLALAAWLRFGVEWVEESIDIGAGPDARRNPFFAAELFLEARGFEVETVSGLQLLDDLPDVSDTIFLSSSRRTLSERRTQRLEQWIRSGGHAVVVASELYDEDTGRSRDALLDALDVHLREGRWWEAEADESSDESEDEWEDAREDDGDAWKDEREDDRDAWEENDEGDARDEGSEMDAAEEQDDQAESDDAEAVALGELMAQLGRPRECAESDEHLAFLVEREPGDDTKIALDHDRAIELVWRSGLELASHNGTQLAQVDVERGRLTVATGLEPFTNGAIHCHDHAYVLARLLAGSDGIWMLHDPDMPALTDLVARHAPLTCLAGGLFVLCFGASRSLRFGARPPPVERARRDLVEHIEAAAGLRWRATRLAPDLEAMLDVLGGRGRREPGAAGDTIEALTRAPLPTRRRELVRWIQTHQEIGRTR